MIITEVRFNDKYFLDMNLLNMKFEIITVKVLITNFLMLSNLKIN